MPRHTKLSKSAASTFALLRHSPTTVFSNSDLAKLFYAERQRGAFTQQTKLSDFIEFGVVQRLLTKITLRSKKYRHSLIRYCLEDPSPYALAQSVRPTGYLSHDTAAHLHGLTPKLPRIQYVNVEQSKKQKPPGPITQESLDRAFSSKQRISNLSYSSRGITVTILNGKHTGCTGVEQVRAPSFGLVHVTTLERTLIDIAVRPAYAGGIDKVLDCYRQAKNRVSVPTLISTLEQLDFAYPYVHAVGFLLQRVGLALKELEPLKSAMSDVNFYVAHAMSKPQYDPTWRIFVPSSLPD